ncbi:hypothetical protein ACWCPI_14130 [Streptomyces sp. NPDC001920]
MSTRARRKAPRLAERVVARLVAEGIVRAELLDGHRTVCMGGKL